MPLPAIESAKIAVTAELTFGLRLLREIVRRQPGENVFISPLSLFLALQMTANGSAGATRDAMWNVLALDGADADALNASAAALQSQLQSSGKAELKIANALWAAGHITLAPEFVKLCEAVFSASVSSLNFADPSAAAEINKWVSANTNGKISDMVTPKMVADAAMILTNAVYFAGKWRNKFAKSATLDEPFHKAGGVDRPVPMMHHPGLTGAYRSGSKFEGAMLPYLGSSMFFYALLPDQGQTPQDVLAAFDVAQLGRERASGQQTEFDLDLKLPRFSLDFSASVSDDLKRMGMEIAFRYPDADFGPMGSKLLYISDVIHKTRLEVDEDGTVAAAASAVVMGVGSAMRQPRPKKTLVFDRPFAVLIGDSQTGAVLFAGIIEDPSL